MKCVHTFGTGRHKRQADITLLFQYITVLITSALITLLIVNMATQWNKMPTFLLFMFCVCHAFLSFHCSLVVICWERADLLDCLYVKFSWVFDTFPCDLQGLVWHLIVSIPGLCLLTYIKL